MGLLWRNNLVLSLESMSPAGRVQSPQARGEGGGGGKSVSVAPQLKRKNDVQGSPRISAEAQAGCRKRRYHSIYSEEGGFSRCTCCCGGACRAHTPRKYFLLSRESPIAFSLCQKKKHKKTQRMRARMCPWYSFSSSLNNLVHKCFLSLCYGLNLAFATDWVKLMYSCGIYIIFVFDIFLS